MSNTDGARQKVLGALLANALLRWETLVTLMVTVILFLFVRDVNLPMLEWQPWFWLVLGGLAETVLVASTLSDPEATEQALAEDFEREYDLRNIRNRISRERLRDAFEYRRNMMKLADRSQGSMRTRLRTLVSDVSDWISYMYNLAERIDLFESNEIILRDRQQVPRKIAEVKQQIKTETDARTRHDREQQLKLLQQQHVSLEASASIIKRAKIQLESTLSALGTAYAQMSLLGHKDSGSARGQRLSIEIKDEIDKLQDTIDAMDEVHLHGRTLSDELREAIDQSDEAVSHPDEVSQVRLSVDSQDEIEAVAAALDEDEAQLQSRQA